MNNTDAASYFNEEMIQERPGNIQSQSIKYGPRFLATAAINQPPGGGKNSKMGESWGKWIKKQ